MNFLKLKNVLLKLMAVFAVAVLLTSFTLNNLKEEASSEITNSLSWNTIPSSIVNGNNKVKVNYSINESGIVMVQAFNDKWDLIGQETIIVSAGTGKLAFTLPAENPSPSINYLQASLLKSNWEQIIPKLNEEISSSSTPPETSNNSLSWNVIPTNISNRVKVNYSTDQNGILVVQVFDSNWKQIEQVEELVSPGSARQTLNLTNGVSTSDNHLQAKLLNLDWKPIANTLYVKLP